MKALFDFFPLILFFTAFKLFDIYVATAVAIAATFAQVGFVWFRHRRFETTHIVTLAIISIFGGMTLIFHDENFIKWKPSIVNWVFALVVLGSQFIGREPVLKRLMGKQMSMPDAIWKRVNLSWGVFFLLMGFLNMYVAFYYQPDAPIDVRRETWVNFKVFWMLGLTLVFSIGQMLLISKYIDPESLDQSKSTHTEDK